MHLGDLILPEDVHSGLRPTSKRQLLQELAGYAAARTGLGARTIFDALLQRERLGSTGVGNGIAIPHSKLPEIAKLTCIFARLDKAVAFDSHDDLPVDLVFVLLAPESAGADHLKALARIARIAREPDMADKLRDTRDVAAIYALLAAPAKSNAA